MIWIIGGTSEAREIINRIGDLASFVATIATEEGKELISSDRVVVGRMNYDEMKEFSIENRISLIVDLTHPYAKIVSSNAKKLAKQVNIKYIRYTREKIGASSNSIVLNSYGEAYDYLTKIKGTVFFTTGSKNIEDFEKVRGNNRFVYRILPVVDSIEKCNNQNLDMKDIVALLGPFSIDHNKSMFKEYKADYVVMKDSGTRGGTSEKIKACEQLNIVPIIIGREKEKGIDDLNEIEKIIRKETSIMNLLKNTLEKIQASTKEAKKITREKFDGLVKPMGSLGNLEEAAIKISGMTGKTINYFNKKAIVVMSADNGVVEEGVSAPPQVFTRVLAESTANGITGVAVLGKHTNTDIYTVDIGMNGQINNKKIIDKKISNGTKNFTKEAAMTYDQALKSIEVGIEIGDELFEKGYDILGVGELGIGNTSTSAAVLSVLTGLDVDVTSGKGAGLTEEQYINKKNTILKGIQFNKPNRQDPIDVLAKVGGFDMGGMCGLYLSAAKNKRPIVIDGLISSVAALCAVRLNKDVIDYVLPSHLSDEPGAKYVMEELNLQPMINLKMRLGEGSACPLAFQILESATFILENMGTFEEASLNSSVLVDMREE